MSTINSWTTEKERLEVIARGFDPSIKLYTTDHWISTTLEALLYYTVLILTLGFVLYDRWRFRHHFARTFANYHFYPEEWSVDTVLRVLPHEARHTRQFRFFGFWIHPLVGLPLMTIVYTLFLLPVFFAIGRLLLEVDAEKTAWYYLYYTGRVDIQYIRDRSHSCAASLSSGNYFYSTPLCLANFFYSRAAKKTIKELTGV